MAESEELIEGLVRFGRQAVQDYVTRSRDIGDTMRYIRAEQCLEIVRLTSVTTNLVDLERKDISLHAADGLQESVTNNLNRFLVREREV